MVAVGKGDRAVGSAGRGSVEERDTTAGTWGQFHWETLRDGVGHASELSLHSVKEAGVFILLLVFAIG